MYCFIFLSREENFFDRFRVQFINFNYFLCISILEIFFWRIYSRGSCCATAFSDYAFQSFMYKNFLETLLIFDLFILSVNFRKLRIEKIRSSISMENMLRY